MLPPEKSSTEPIANLTVPIIGVRTEGTGTPLVDGQVIVTPDHQPNLVMQIVGPVTALLVRNVYLYLKSLLGTLTTTMGTAVIPTGGNPVLEAMHALTFVQLLVTAAGLAVAPTAIGILGDLITIFSGLEKKFPLATGSV